MNLGENHSFSTPSSAVFEAATMTLHISTCARLQNWKNAIETLEARDIFGAVATRTAKPAGDQRKDCLQRSLEFDWVGLSCAKPFFVVWVQKFAGAMHGRLDSVCSEAWSLAAINMRFGACGLVKPRLALRIPPDKFTYSALIKISPWQDATTLTRTRAEAEAENYPEILDNWINWKRKSVFKVLASHIFARWILMQFCTVPRPGFWEEVSTAHNWGAVLASCSQWNVALQILRSTQVRSLRRLNHLRKVKKWGSEAQWSAEGHRLADPVTYNSGINAAEKSHIWDLALLLFRASAATDGGKR